MNPNDRFDEEQAILALLENLPMSKFTPEELKDKLIDLAGSPAPRHRNVRRPFFAVAFGGAMVVAAIALMTSLPATAKSWELIKKAVQGVTRMEMTVRDLGEKNEIVHIAFAPGTILVQPEGEEQVFISNGVVQVYDKEKNVVQEITLPMGNMIPDIGKEVLGAMSMSKMLADYEREYGKQNIHVGQIRNLQGRKVYDVVLTNPKEGGHANLTVDAETDLPTFIEAFENRKGQVVKVTEIVAKYNDAVDVSAITPNFPPDAKHEKIDVSQMMGDEKGKNPPPGLHFDFGN
jgi:hypothetical protein